MTIPHIVKQLFSLYPRWQCRREYQQQTLAWNERPVELAFVFRHLASLYPQSVLDVGTGKTALPALLRGCGMVVTAIDSGRALNRHWQVLRDDITDPVTIGPFDLISCISALEHIPDADAAMHNMFRLLASNGRIVLTFPYTEAEYVPNVYALPGSKYFGQRIPYVTQSFSRDDLNRWLAQNGGRLVEQEYWQVWMGQRWSEGNRIIPPRQTSRDHEHQLTCVIIAPRLPSSSRLAWPPPPAAMASRRVGTHATRRAAQGNDHCPGFAASSNARPAQRAGVGGEAPSDNNDLAIGD